MLNDYRMIEIESIFNWWFISFIMFGGYISISGILHVITYRRRRNQLLKYKLQRHFSSRNKIKKEILYSLSTLVIYSISSWLVFLLYEMGVTKIYFDINTFSIGYFFSSIVIMLIIHDTYFYWTHRLIHHPKFFNIIHKVHHLSINPTPWASFSFHPFEALISIGYIFIFIFLFPCHPIALFIFLSIMFTINVIGHLGYEFFPEGFMKSNIGKWINSSTFHNYHHKRSNYNYGLYFTFWDRLMGTFKHN